MAKIQNHSYLFKYEGDFNSLDALTVLQTQLNFVTALKEIKDIKYPEVKLDIRIKGAEKGSLDINHVIDIAAVSGMFILEHYDYIKTVFEIFGDIVKLKKFLKGEKAEKVVPAGNDQVHIYINGDNITINSDAFKIYQNSPTISNAFNNSSKILSDRPEIDYIEVSDKKNRKKVLKIEKSEFESLGSDNPYLSKITDKQTKKEQILFIKKPNLFPEKNKKWVWELIHAGRDIKAIIDDKKFLAQINEGLKVGQGDRLKADLTIHYKFDERLNTFIESGKYEVTNIIDIIGRSINTKLDFLDN